MAVGAVLGLASCRIVVMFPWRQAGRCTNLVCAVTIKYTSYKVSVFGGALGVPTLIYSE